MTIKGFTLPLQVGMYNPAEHSNIATVQDFGPSLTQQSQTEDSDINVIVKRFGLTGRLPDNVQIPQYADYDDVFDFHTASNVVRRATEEFNKLPADVRLTFNNDPGAFHDYASNPDNIDGLRELGLAKAKETAPAASNPAGDVPPSGSSGAA